MQYIFNTWLTGSIVAVQHLQLIISDSLGHAARSPVCDSDQRKWYRYLSSSHGLALWSSTKRHQVVRREWQREYRQVVHPPGHAIDSLWPAGSSRYLLDRCCRWHLHPLSSLPSAGVIVWCCIGNICKSQAANCLLGSMSVQLCGSRDCP